MMNFLALRRVPFLLCAICGIVFFARTVSVQAQFQPPVLVPTTLQLIHNAADPTLSPIDISLGTQSALGTRQTIGTLPNVYFRTNTPPLINVGGILLDTLFGKQLVVGFNSTSGTVPPSTPYATLPFGIGKGANIVIAGGVLTPNRFVVNPNAIATNTRLFQFIDTVSTTTAATVRLLVFHGVTDAPQMDVSVRGIGKIATLYYGEGMWVNVPTADYIVDVRISTSQTLVGSYVAPLQTFNMAGQRVTLMASGFRQTATSNNRLVQSQYASPFALIAVPSDSLSLPVSLSSVLPTTPPPTTLQVIHNSPDATYNRMSIWAGSAVTTGTVRFIPFIPNFTFRNATQSTDAFVTTIAVPGSGNPPTVIREEILFGSVLGTLLAINPQVNQPRPGQTLNFNRFPGASITRGNSIIIAHGVSNLANYAPNPDTTVDRTLRLTTFTDPIDDVDTTTVRVLLFNGVTDSPVTDFVLRETGDTVASLRYGQGKLITLPPNNYTLDIVGHNSEDLLGSYIMPLFEHIGRRITVMTSGFVNSVQNRNGAPLAMVLVSPLPGRQPDVLTAIPLPAGTAPTTLQIINNAADPALSPVRVWLGRPTVNNALGAGNPIGNPNNPNANTAETVTTYNTLEPSLRFRQGTLAESGFGDFIPFYKDVISVTMNLNLTTTASRTATTALLSTPFSIGRGANILISSGVTPSRTRLYAANPDGIPTQHNIAQFVDTYRLTTTDIVRIFAFNGMTDAPSLEFVARGNFPMITTVATTTTLGTTTINTVTLYTSATMSLGTAKYGSGVFTTIPTGDYAIDVRRTDAAQTTIATFTATFATASLGGQRITLAASGFWNSNAQNQTSNPMRMLAVVNTALPLMTTINTVTLATTTTGTIVELITTTSISVPHSFLLPIQLYPQTGSGVALQNASETLNTVATKLTFETSTETSSNAALSIQTFPNPTTDLVQLQYRLKESATVSISIHDAFGQVITRFAPVRQEQGENIVELDMSALPRGVYQVLVSTPQSMNRAKVMVTK